MMARWLLLAWASLCSGNKFLAFHEPSHSLNEKVQVHLLNAGSESSDDAEVRQTVEDHSRRSERRIARHRSERRARNPHEPLVEITDLSLQHGLGKEADGIDIDIVKVNTNMLLPSSYSVSLVTTTEAPSSNRGNCVCSQGNFLHWSTKECVPQKPWGFECGFFPRQQQNRVCQDGLICKRLNATDLYASSGKYTGWTSTSPASCEYCTKEDDCTSGMERHLADCVRTGDLKRMEEELEDEEKDLEPWEDSEVFEAWGHKGAQLHDSDAEDLDSFGRQEPKMCVTVKVTVPALTMRDESTRLIEAKLNTTLQVIANATQKAHANASASGKSRRQAVAEVQAEANASYNATAYAEATYTAYAEATDRATATYKAVATAEAKEKTKVGATDVTAAARRNGTGAATKIANATRSVKAKGEAGVLVKLNQSGHGKASAEAEEKATVHLEDVERVTKNATVTVEGHGGLKKVFQATATAKAIVEAKACISARQARKMLSEQTMKDSGKSFARAVYKKAEREAYAEAKDRATRTAVKLATEAAQKRIDQDIEHQVKDYTEAHREELEKMALEDAVNSTRDLKESLQAKAVKEAMQKAVEKVKTEAPLEAQRRADAKAKKAAEDQATKLATEEAREEAQEGLEKKAVIKAREEAQEKVDAFVPTVVERYRQLLMPALKISLAMLTSLGSHAHKEVASKVLHFVVSHVDVFISILQDRQAVHSSGSLQELVLVTGIVCNMGLTEVSLTADDELGQEQIQLRGPLARIQRLMIGLLPRYCSSDSWEKIIKSVMEQNNEEPGIKYSVVAMETTQKLQRICSNVVGYCRAVMNSAGSVPAHCHVLFSPSLTDSLTRDSHLTREALRTSSMVSSYRPVSLGLPVTFMKKCSDQILQTAELYTQVRLKLQNLTELTSEELRELSQVQFGGAAQERLSTQQRHQLVQRCLTQIIQYKAQEISSYLYIIENCLFVLWRHLDFYFLHCIPSDEERRMLAGPTLVSSHMRRLQERTLPAGSSFTSGHAPEPVGLGDGVTREEIEALKRETISVLTETVLKKLVEIEQTHGKGRTRVGFIQVLVRRIKRLLTIHGAPVRNEQMTSGPR